jgi:hypothetical protein
MSKLTKGLRKQAKKEKKAAKKARKEDKKVGAGWLVVVLTSRIELMRQELHRERFAEPRRVPLPQRARFIRSWRSW